MMLPKNINLQVKITVLIFVLLITFSYGVTFYLTYRVEEKAFSMAHRYVGTIPYIIENSISKFMIEGNRESIRSMISQIVDDDLVLGVHVFNSLGALSCGCIAKKDGSSDKCADESEKYPPGYLNKISEVFVPEKTSKEVALNDMRFISFYRPYENEQKCMSCHPSSEKILGVLNVNIDVSELLNFFKNKMTRVQMIMFGFSVVLTILLSILIKHLIVKPVQALEKGLQDVSNGDLNTRVRIHSKDELERVSKYFNLMVYSMKRANRKIDQMHQNMIHSDRLMTIGQLMASISHEIKNPLNSIMITADILQMKCSDPEKKKQLGHYLENIVEDSSKIQHIVDQTLSFSRIEQPVIDQICVDEFMQNIEVYAERIIFMNNNVVFNVQKLREECQSSIRFNRVSLEQIFINILKNAFESFDGGDGEVNVVVDVGDKSAYFQISDNGHGIPLAAREHVFEEFYTTKNYGTGLGLSIAKKLIEDFDGTIRFESEEGVGTTFVIQLPINNKSNENG